MKYLCLLFLISVFLLACGNKNDSKTVVVLDSAFAGKGSFAYDLEFLQKYQSVIVLGEASSPAKVAIVNDYQARIMTSTARGDEGESFGWINYSLIESGAHVPHINAVGGEDRIWLGPEGGQYSLFFKKDQPFKFENWNTPAVIDSGAFELVAVSVNEATFKKSARVTNYKGFTFQFEITRQINLLNNEAIGKIFGISTQNLSSVGYQSTNFLTNRGTDDWTKKNGLLSIWILGMFTPSERTNIVVPYEEAKGSGKRVTDDYFGPIPSERILKKPGLVILKGDGRFRGKVGIPPSIAKEFIGSYNAEKHILTLVKFDLEKTGTYVNSKWEIQKDPFAGDAVNAYNDGPLQDGKQLGPFYELESSSSAKELKPGQSMIHRHITLHLEGDEKLLDAIAQLKLGVSLKEIAGAFDRDR